MDTFTRAYIDCALWSSTCNRDEYDDESLEQAGYDVDDLAPAALAFIVEDCEAFQRDHADDIATRHNGDSAASHHVILRRLAKAGHDFWLTRNGHGAGFWDGDWPAEVGRRLTDAAHVYGEVSLYVGYYGKIHA